LVAWSLGGEICPTTQSRDDENRTYRMISIRQTQAFIDWLEGLRDRQARVRIQLRIDRLALGNPGDVKPVGERVSELRIHYGPGYRVYFVEHGAEVIVLLAGGDKSTQSRDIQTALQLARDLEP